MDVISAKTCIFSTSIVYLIYVIHSNLVRSNHLFLSFLLWKFSSLKKICKIVVINIYIYRIVCVFETRLKYTNVKNGYCV